MVCEEGLPRGGRLSVRRRRPPSASERVPGTQDQAIAWGGMGTGGIGSLLERGRRIEPPELRR